MTSNNCALKTSMALGLLLQVTGCSSNSSVSTAAGTCTAGSTTSGISLSQTTNGSSISSMTGFNILPLTVGASLSDGINEPSVSVQVCEPASPYTCVTIPNVLVDTGSYGLRVFSSLVTSLTLPSVTGGTGYPLGECVTYADNSADWGPVVKAGVILGSESAVTVPIQLIEPSFGNSSVCSGDLDESPDSSSTGFNGILGVGLFAEDCGDGCVPGYTDAADNGIYYSCNGTNCTGAAVNLQYQVTNPVAAETTDNNGVIVKLPTVSGGAATSVSGYLVLGIGTESNNTPSGVTAYSANSDYGYFDVSCNGQDYSESYIDSGSNALFFGNAAANLPEDSSGWYAPTSTLTLDALVTANSGGNHTYVPLTVTNFDDTVGGSNFVYSTIAGDIGVSNTFDLGLPFFFGRNTYVGLENTSSSIGSGTYWAF